MKRNRILFLLLIFTVVGCNKYTDFKSEVFQPKGIPDVNQNFSYMHFINEHEGYLFGSIQHWSNMTNKKSENLNSPHRFTEEAIIYKTMDGGENWILIDSLCNSSFYNSGVYYDGCIYIQLKNSKKDYGNNLVRFKLADNNITVLKYNFERMGRIWINGNKIAIDYLNKGISKILFTDSDFKKIDSINCNKVFMSNVLSVRKQSVALTYDYQLYNITNNKTYNFRDSVYQDITLKNKNEIFILGSMNNTVKIFTFNIATNRIKKIGNIPEYHIVTELQSNNNVISCFVGNIIGMFVFYDLLYSVDEGKTWKIRKLEIDCMVHPSCLIGNILYISSGNNMMQKIVLK